MHELELSLSDKGGRQWIICYLCFSDLVGQVRKKEMK